MSDEIDVIVEESTIDVSIEEPVVVDVTIQEPETVIVEESPLVTIIAAVDETVVHVLEVAEQGPPGRDGVDSDKTYVHHQIAASSVWNIQHGLNKYPSVSIVDSGNSEVVGEVDYIDVNSVVVSFTAEFGGRAYLN